MAIALSLIVLLLIVASIVTLVCLIMVIIKMFQNDQSTLGIVTIILSFCGGIGELIAFVVGWMNAGKWNIRNVMLAWTASIVASIVLVILAMTMGVFAGLQEVSDDFPQNFEPPPFEAPEF